MVDQPYTTPEEDPFNVRPLLPPPRRRRSSMLDKWIQEQQRSSTGSSCNTEDLTSDGNLRLNPYLAYPDLPQPANPSPNPCASTVSLNSYEVVDDDEIAQFREESDEIQQNPMPATPTSSRRSHFLGSPSSTLRHLHLSIRPSTPTRQSPSSMASSRSASRMSFLGFGTPSARNVPHQHNRSSSLSTLNTSTAVTSIPDLSPSTKWRPSVLGIFSSPTPSQVSVSSPSETLYAPSRPSMSSSNTATTSTSLTTATAVATEDNCPPPSQSKPQVPKTFVSSLRLRRRSHANLLNVASSENPENNVSRTNSQRARSSRAPLAPKGGTLLAGNLPLDDPLEDDEDDDDDGSCQPQKSVASKAGPPRPEVAFTASNKGGTLPRVTFASLSSRSQKKKKLVISGISSNDIRKFEGAKRWCESFGEVTQIVRMPNGDLHVHFKSAEVADTVCRLRAKVYIAGVGSVNLSWYTGNKR
ncbi:hypothetical protein V5O48_003524 [Marasmius crinis-equi]|uniref:RRM domain-containing protein n=1 Tax=Marasmius crinis-equi TaxID=585013 RepID=A0ABR3FSM6_9AGAR